MSRKVSALGFIKRVSPIHALTGSAKLLMTLLCSIAVMITYDTRFLAGMIVLSMILFRVSRIRLKELRFVFVTIAVLMLFNAVTIYLFAPEQGVLIYGTRHVLFQFTNHYTVTKEQLFYMVNVLLKYFSVLPVALLFITTTEPSEFASSLNRLGVSYKACYAVALTLRYIPDVQRDYHNISQAQQARGIDTSRNAKLTLRVKNAISILLPLVFSSLGRIENISNAMELRGFGKHKKRTWYTARSFKQADYAAVAVSACLLGVSLLLNVVNKGRFYNPFI